MYVDTKYSKQCSTCLEWKDKSNFGRRTLSKDGLLGQCKECISAWKESRRDELRDNNYKNTYGISLDEYNEKLKLQNNRCEICKTHESEVFGGRLHVDHRHKDSAIRGLLCRNCNIALGFLKEDADIVAEMLHYIRKYNG